MDTLKFFPFQSSIHPGFWSALAKTKLEVTKLDELPVEVWGSFTHSDPPKSGLSPRLSVEWNAFQEKFDHAWNQFGIRGNVVIKNTIESFKKEDKSAYIRRMGSLVWDSIVSGKFWRDPTSLCPFSILLFGDLKKYVFYYWFAFPAFNIPQSITVNSCVKLADVFSEGIISTMVDEFRTFLKERPGSVYSLVVIDQTSTIKFSPFEDLVETCNNTTHRVMVCVADPCSVGEYPGWPVRNLILAIAVAQPHLLDRLEILCLRMCTKDGQVEAGHSIILTMKGPGEKISEMPGVVGWEKNDKGQMAPRMVNMRGSMDPLKIAESSVDLNLKLMKWRLVPEIQLEKIRDSHYLILGSGTLGCGVGRCLLGWGVRHITFVDNSKVSFSNPVRQSLFEFSDCLEGGKPKAVAAAKKCRDIFPGVAAEGFNINIPMPGHPISESVEEEVRKAHDDLARLIRKCNVIFLLMDSRESRWLPTLMAACYPEKLVINAALGYDTFLVMRHGIRLPASEANPAPAPTEARQGVVGGERLGCYFCNDVMAPRDSTTDRSLDMQCTVTRPGASATAAALAVELAMSCLQHSQGPAAPSSSLPDSSDTSLESCLGLVPHSIRGSLFSFTQFLPSGPSFTQCTACGPAVLDMYRREGFEMVKKAGASTKYLEDMTGLTELLNDTSLMDAVMMGTEDDDFSVSSE